MKVLLRTLMLNRLNDGLPVSVVVPYKSGKSTATVSCRFLFKLEYFFQNRHKWPDTLNKLIPTPAKKPYIARSVRFCDQGEAVLVFMLESHEVYVHTAGLSDAHIIMLVTA